MITLRWHGELKFIASTEKNQEIHLDSASNAAASPMEALLAALCGCMGIDVIDILTKMRQEPTSFEIIGSAERNGEPPKYFKSVDLVFKISGDIDAARVERAVQLSFDRYCSVYHTLRPDLEVTHRIEFV